MATDAGLRVLAILVAYSLVGVVVLGRLRQRMERRRPANSTTWTRSQRLREAVIFSVFLQVWVVVGGLLAFMLMEVTSPVKHEPSFILVGMGGVVALFAAFDVLTFRAVRRTARWERAADAHTDEASPSP
jgi:hypothetical protein